MIEIASITGHATLQVVSRYTNATEQRKFAQFAMRRPTPKRSTSASQTYSPYLGIPPRNLNVSNTI